MIKYTFLVFLIIQLFIFSCTLSGNSKAEFIYVDSLNKKIADLSDEIRTDKSLSPHIQVRNYEAATSSVILYIPWGFNLYLSDVRPNLSPEISLVVPAAFTTPLGGIDGFFFKEGVMINPSVNRSLTGICKISGNQIYIGPFKDSALNLKNLKGNESVFQQALLVYNSKLYPSAILGNAEYKRRAIVQFDDLTCVAESNRALSIREFQEALLFIGVINAIYLDMGSWSEGVYRDHIGNIKKIGDDFSNTTRQTNWIYYAF